MHARLFSIGCLIFSSLSLSLSYRHPRSLPRLLAYSPALFALGSIPYLPPLSASCLPLFGPCLFSFFSSSSRPFPSLSLPIVVCLRPFSLSLVRRS